MRAVGFSTGAVALGDFDRALQLIDNLNAEAVELSALRISELSTLISALGRLRLEKYKHVSLHSPSAFTEAEEHGVIQQLRIAAAKGYCVVVHPDAMHNVTAWRVLGDRLCIENMDKRKPVGRTSVELRHFFDLLPEASMCFDIAHARQVDSSMTEAYRLLREYGSRVRQVHVSEVSTSSRHERMSPSAADDYAQVLRLIPDGAVFIIEAQVPAKELRNELQAVQRLLAREADLLASTFAIGAT